jgi:hypothetical protein
MLHIVCVTYSMVGNRSQADIANSPRDIPCEGAPRSMIWLLSRVRSIDILIAEETQKKAALFKLP